MFAPASGAEPVPNPPLRTDSCGLRVALLVDTSSSIHDADDENPARVRQAATSFVEALRGTPSVVSIHSFRRRALREAVATGVGGAEGLG